MLYTADKAMRLDEFVKQNAQMTRSRAQKLIEDGHVLVDGLRPTKAGQTLKIGQSVQVEIPAPVQMAAVAQDIPIEIVYQDEYLAVVNKPCGMVVHPAAGNPDGTMVNALLGKLDHLSGIGGELRPGILHRIDKDTTGLLLVAKNDEAHAMLSAQIAAHTMGRVYLALLQGALKQDEGDVDAPIGRHPTDRKKMAIVRGGREAPAPSQGYGAAAPVNTEPQILPSRYLLSRPADSLLIRSPALWTIWSRDWYRTG